MPDWRETVEEYYALDWQLVMPSGAELHELRDLARVLQVRFPDEFASLYRTMNGFGGTDGKGVVEWAALPLEEIPTFSDRIRSWFSETHPEVAARFIPFLDWHCGDATGYLKDEQGKVLSHLRTFFHEEYHFDESQPYEEFLVEDEATIHDFLTLWPYIE